MGNPIVKRIALVLGLSCLVWVLSARAHHSSAMFDNESTVELDATVKEFQWTSPHVWIQVYVADDSGMRREWSIEGSVPNRLYRLGWRPQTFQPGQKVTLRINPMKDGTPAGLFVGARFADGSELGRFAE